MASNRVVHFEIPANDPQGLAKFYGDLFGWTCTRAPNPAVEYWNVDTGAEAPGINGGIVKRQHAQHPCMNYVDVASLDAAIAKATELGAHVALPKTPIPGVGMMACLLDPEGHVFGLIERAQA
jgi:uncharacterized protein